MSTTQYFHFAITFEPLGEFHGYTPFSAHFFVTFSKKCMFWHFLAFFDNFDVNFEVDVNYFLRSIFFLIVFSIIFKMQNKRQKLHIQQTKNSSA
jgi:hypothetical protein